MRRTLLAVVSIVSALWWWASPAAAGGWAMGTLDTTPAPVAGRPLEVGFTILQHGVTPARVDADVGIAITDADGATRFVPAVASGAVGHYVATVQLDEPGRTRWVLHLGWFGPQDLGEIAVAAAEPTASLPVAATSAATPPAPTASEHRWPAPARYATALGACALAGAAWATRRRPHRVAGATA